MVFGLVVLGLCITIGATSGELIPHIANSLIHAIDWVINMTAEMMVVR